MLENNTGKDIPATVLPNGMVDLAVIKNNTENPRMIIRGIDTMPHPVIITAGTKMFSIGFKLLAVEYLFKNSVKDVLNSGKNISKYFGKIEENDMSSFELFCETATQKIKNISRYHVIIYRLYYIS